MTLGVVPKLCYTFNSVISNHSNVMYKNLYFKNHLKGFYLNFFFQEDVLILTSSPASTNCQQFIHFFSLNLNRDIFLWNIPTHVFVTFAKLNALKP